MSKTKDDLIKAFHEDHAVLGKGFSDLSGALRAGDLARARAYAREVDAAAGAHIAFEEKDFYPRLAESLGEREVEALYRDHGRGFEVVDKLLAMEPDQALDPKTRQRMIEDCEAMETHIAECADLFRFMAALPELQQEGLLRRLEDWRRREPSWHDFKVQNS